MIHGALPDPQKKFLPDPLAQAAAFDFLEAAERRFVSRIQGRTYARVFGRLGREPMFLGVEEMLAGRMPEGQSFFAEPQVLAAATRGCSAWSLYALTCLAGILAKEHYRQSIDADPELDPLWRNLFYLHSKEAMRRASGDEIAWWREDARLKPAARERAVDDLIVLIGTVDAILQQQAGADTMYFAHACGRGLARDDLARIEAGFLHAYRWQYIVSGVQAPHFCAMLARMVSASQHGRIAAALAPLFEHEGTRAVRASGSDEELRAA